MNPERLLAHFETISEAPDAIARLRRFIHDLAVRGRLVEQNPEDEPAEELFGEYLEKRMDLVSQGKIRRPKPSRPISDEERPIDLPCGWAWARLNEIGNLSGGMTPSMGRPDYWDGEIPWLSPKDIKVDEISDSEIRLSELGLSASRLELYPPGCLFIVARSGILKRALPISINRVPAAANQDMKVLAPFVEGQERYLQIMLRGLTGFILRNLVKTGTTVQSLKYGEFAEQPFPIPPLAEQHRIVAKVDELMALCDQLEAARQQREQCRERLVAASLQRLNQPSEDQEAFRSDARFALQVLPSLTSTPAQIKQLRQTILNLAVRGKLVEQDPEDEDKMARSRLVDFAERSYSLIPVSWLRVPLACLLDEDTRNGYSRKPDDAEDGFPILRISAGTARPDGLVDEGEFKLISGIDEDLASQYSVKRGDLLACRFNGNKAYVGRLSLFMGYSGKKFIYPDKLIRVRLSEWLAEPSFFRWISSSDLVREEVEERCATTVGNWGISAGKLKTCMLPLPPLAEQQRIVAMVDELMALCDKLEQQLSQADQQRRRLLEAVLAEALRAPEKALASVGSA